MGTWKMHFSKSWNLFEVQVAMKITREKARTTRATTYTTAENPALFRRKGGNACDHREKRSVYNLTS